ncbi:MAG: class II fructose-bisphosphate aldolase [Thermoguttaceae bacterium]|jgi:ketose-bisphosphate aldolase
MPLEPAAELLAHARRNRFAVGYFESWDVASLEGVIDAAEQVHAPIIIGFNGEFLSRGDRSPPARLDWYGALARVAAESARVPCAAMFNECPLDAWVEDATRAGFNLVMLADATAGYGDLARRVTELVGIAHPRGVAVEAELGLLPSGERAQSDAVGSLTDPDLAAAFVRETGVDALAVSAGNVHVLLDGQRELDLPRLAAIARQVDVPLVLHGGSGIEPSSLGKAIALGVAKVNYGTYLKQRCLAAWQRSMAVTQSTPHHALGNGGEADLMVIGRQAVRDAVLQRIETLGCCGRA